MALQALGGVSSSSSSSLSSFSSSSLLRFPRISSIVFPLFPSRPLRFHLLPLKAQATSQSSISSPSPLFLPHLQFDHEENDSGQGGASEEEYFDEELDEDDEEEEEEEASDPILDFFKSRSSSSVADPKQEGSLSLQRNRRTSWRIADVGSTADIEEEELVFASPADVIEPLPQTTDDGVVGEILCVARSLPENATLGDFLGSYVGRVGEGECIELLGRMGEEGLAWGCLTWSSGWGFRSHCWSRRGLALFCSRYWGEPRWGTS